jgi:hypothetical protein
VQIATRAIRFAGAIVAADHATSPPARQRSLKRSPGLVVKPHARVLSLGALPTEAALSRLRGAITPTQITARRTSCTEVELLAEANDRD